MDAEVTCGEYWAGAAAAAAAADAFGSFIESSRDEQKLPIRVAMDSGVGVGVGVVVVVVVGWWFTSI